MFGLIMGIALGIGGIVSGVKHICQNHSSEQRALRNYLNGNNPSQTYYDPFVGSDIDLFSGKKVTIKKLDWSNDQYVVDDKTGKVLRNITQEKKMKEIENYKWNGKKVVKLYSGAETDKMWLEKYGPNYPYLKGEANTYIDIYMHCKTKKKCIHGSIYYKTQKKLEEYLKDMFGYEDTTNSFRWVWGYYDLFNGTFVDFDTKENEIKAVKNGEKVKVPEEELQVVMERVNEDIQKGILEKKISDINLLFK